MTKNHLKSLASPRSWNILRKKNVFVTRARPGPHNMELSIPLSVFMRDMIGVAKKVKDVKYLLHEKVVLVNSIRRKDHRFPVGRFDIIEFEETKEKYQILLNERGKLVSKKIKNSKKPLKIKEKTKIRGGKTQLNFMDGSNITVEKDTYKVGDSVVIDKKKISSHLPFQKGAYIYLVGGKHIGQVGVLEDIMENKIIFKNRDKEKIETLKKYAVVIGKDKPLMEL